MEHWSIYLINANKSGYLIAALTHNIKQKRKKTLKNPNL